ncbi:MAG: AAA family ATPase [Archangium sp.]|nr:AAA family ATPase [Archangium sp.]
MTRNSYKTIGLWVVLIVLFVAFYQIFSGPQEPSKTVTWQTVQKLVEQKRVQALTVALENGRGIGHGTTIEGERFTTDSRAVADFSELEKQGVDVFFEEKQGSLWLTIVTQWFPIVVLFVFFTWFMRRLKGKGTTDLLEFKVEAQRITGPVRLDGLSEARARLKAAAEAAKIGTPGPRRILLVGPPGTGKTTLLRAVAADSGLPLLACGGSSFIEVFVGVGSARMRTLFKRAAESAPCVVAIDDFDAFATRRMVADPNGGVVDERATTMLELAGQLDGLGAIPPKVLFLATTSRPDVLDEAIIRPGRFDLKIALLPGGGCTVEELKR